MSEETVILAAVFFGLLLAIFLYLSISAFYIIEQGHMMVVERFGKFSRRVGAGWYYLIPFVESPRYMTWRVWETHYHENRSQVTVKQKQIFRIDMREGVMDFPLQSIITRDNVEIQVHPMLVYHLHDPVRAVYETYDLTHAVEKLVQTALRSVIGDMGLDDTLASREEINRILTQKLHDICLNWGLRLIKVEILEILPTPSIQEAMHKQIAAERIRRAAIISADGYRIQVKTEAEGKLQSATALSKGVQQVSILRAKGISEAKVILAKAEAEAVRLLGSILQDYGVDPIQYILSMKYIDTFKEIALGATNRMLYFPYEVEVVGGIKDLARVEGKEDRREQK